MDNLNKHGKSQLSQKQIADLHNIYLSIDNDVDIVNTIIHKDIIDLLRNKIYTNINKIIISILFIILIILFTLYIFKYNNYNEYDNLNLIKDSYCNTVIRLEMNKDDLSLSNYIDRVSIDMGNTYMNIDNINWIYSNIDLINDEYTIDNVVYNIDDKLKPSILNISRDLFYMQYTNDNKNASKEIIISNSIPNNLNINNINKVNERYYEYSNTLENIAYIHSYNNIFIMLIEKIAGGNIVNESLKNDISIIENSITKANIEEPYKISILLGEDTYINLHELTCLGDYSQIIYDYESDMLRIRNYKENLDYFYIFGVNNEFLDINITNFLSTNYENFYVHKDFDDINSNGYKTFLINIDDNLYCIKIQDINYDYVYSELLSTFNIDVDSVTINSIQEVIPYTIN